MRLTLNIPGQRQFLGEILVREGMVRDEDLQEALAEQRRQGTRERLGTILMRLGFLAPSDFMKALSKQLTTVHGYSRPVATYAPAGS